MIPPSAFVCVTSPPGAAFIAAAAPSAPFALTLAQGAGTDADLPRLVINIGVLILAIVAIFGIFVFLKKRLLTPDTAGSADEEDALSLARLRSLHASGKISDAEYATLKRAALLAAGVSPDRIDRPAGTDTNRADRRPDRARAQRPGPRPSVGEDDGWLRAPPGYDLTGEPLPGFDPESQQPPRPPRPPRGDERDTPPDVPPPGEDPG
ncbi:MAG: SHOCT domain-containing protein [Phycisphaerales bacterium]